MGEEANSSLNIGSTSVYSSVVAKSCSHLVRTSFVHCSSDQVRPEELRPVARHCLAILKGQKVEGFVLETKPQPTEFLNSAGTDSESNMTLNPLYEEWITIDQALSGWLFGSMTPSVAADVVNFSTSREVWKALEQMFGDTSRARINQMRGVLHNFKKGSKKMTEYLGLLKQTAEGLKLAGAPVSNADLTSYVLGGLGCNIPRFPSLALM